MYVKVTKSGPRKYVQLVEAYRDDKGRPKQRTIATLGRLEKLGDELQSVIDGLCRVTGRTLPDKPEIQFESARAMGNVWALSELWSQLGFDQLRKIFRGTRHSIQVEALIRIMVLNRLSEPDSKRGVLRWLETVSLPGLQGIENVEHQHLLRAMDALTDRQAEVNETITGLLRPLVDQDLSVVFYDMTTIRTEGYSEPADDLRKYGLSKEGGIAKQVMLGIVQTADGLPLYHEVFEGNTAEVTTLMPTLEKITQRYPVTRIVVVADRGLLSIDNLNELQSMTLPSGEPLEFVLAVPGRRYGDFKEILEPLQQSLFGDADEEVVTETQWQSLRLVVAHDPARAAEQHEVRDKKIAALEEEAGRLACKLDRQDEGVVSRYKSLADIERGFRVLKSEIEIGPVYHRLPKRIKAHAMICFIALILHRVMRMRLKARGSDYSPEHALEQLGRIQHHKANLNNNLVEGLSSISSEQLDIFSTLDIKKPSTTRDLSTL